MREGLYFFPIQILSTTLHGQQWRGGVDMIKKECCSMDLYRTYTKSKCIQTLESNKSYRQLCKMVEVELHNILACCHTNTFTHHSLSPLLFSFVLLTISRFILLKFDGHRKICQRQKTMQTKRISFGGIMSHEICDRIFRTRYFILHSIDIFGHFIWFHLHKHVRRH